jgi:TolA-binding protein
MIMKSVLSLILIAFIFIGCSSKKSDEELFNEAKTNTEEGKIPEAVATYEELIKEYPDSKSAPEALTNLASIYQNKLVKNISETESLQEAAKLFRQIYDVYPESEFAPMGLFMAGFVLANELDMYNEATETYNLFMKTFPEHELAGSAKEELDNMGLTPEEILQKNIAKEE